jgi:hypothetical protein
MVEEAVWVINVQIKILGDTGADAADHFIALRST